MLYMLCSFQPWATWNRLEEKLATLVRSRCRRHSRQNHVALGPEGPLRRCAPTTRVTHIANVYDTCARGQSKTQCDSSVFPA